MKGTKLLKQIYIASAVLFCVGITGCRDKVSDIYKGGKEEPEKVPNDFDFSTSKSVQLAIHYDVPKGYKVHFEAYTKNPISLDFYKNFVKDETINPYIEGWTDENGDFTYTATVASMINEIYVYSSDEGVPMLMKASIVNNTATFLSDKSVVSDFESRAVARAADNYYRNWVKQNCTYKFLGEWNKSGIPEYLLKDDEYSYTPTQAFNGIVNATRPDNSYMATHYNCPFITLEKDANVFINFISHNNSERNNVLAYYVFKDGAPSQDYINKNLIIAFPNTNADELKTGDVIQLKYNDNGALTDKFPAGSNIGFVLLVDAFNEGNINTRTNLMYSQNDFNGWDIADAITHSKPALISYLADGQVVLAFEDMPWDEGAQRNALPNFNDDIFVITSNPIEAIPTPEPGIDPELPEYKMILRETGILGFEDNWPDVGDYDLNDVMMSYVRAFYVDDYYQTLSMDEKYTFINNGANYFNGFGYVIDQNVKNDMISRCEVTSSYSCEGQGLDEDNIMKGVATVMLFNNSKALSKNTTFEVRTVFKNPIFLSVQSKYNGYNPFIVVNTDKNWMNEDRLEVHLPKYAPTPKGNNSLWGTGDDESGNGKYYVRAGDYPFAIQLIDPVIANPPLPDFVVPIETKPVDETYPGFKDWVKSNGEKSLDWYLHPNQ